MRKLRFLDNAKFSGGIVWSVKRKFDQVKLSLYTPKQESSQVLDTNNFCHGLIFTRI